MTHSDAPPTPRPAPRDGSAAAGPERAPGEAAPASKPDSAPASFRYDGAFVRVVSAPPSAPLQEPEPAPATDPDAELAASMARMQQRLDRVAERQTTTAGRQAESLAPAELDARRRRFEPWIVAGIALLACVLAVASYLAAVVPGPWFADEAPRRFAVADIQLVRGSGQRAPDELVVNAPGEGGIVILSFTTDLRADRFRAIAWEVSGLADAAQVRVLWRSDTDPARVQSLPASVEGGRLRPVRVVDADGWVGRIRGLGLSVAGPLPQPLRVHGVAAKPMGAGEVLADRAREWFAPERWSGTSINVVSGGADPQALPLSVAVGAVAALTILSLVLLRRWRPALLPRVGLAIAVVFVCAWLLLDLRWVVNLGGQAALTSSNFGGRSERDKKLADVDGALYAFIEQVRAALPQAPQRVWVASDAPYFNGRAAYHLYPHNVHFRARDRAMPERGSLKAGDWLLVVNRRGVEFNAGSGTVRWDGGVEVPAELKVAGSGAALFLLK